MTLLKSAAQTLIKNVYMDDICDTVDTVDSAIKKLTEEVDAVLETGGFSVKGWISKKALAEKCNDEMKKDMNIFQRKTGIFHFRVRTDLLKLTA